MPGYVFRHCIPPAWRFDLKLVEWVEPLRLYNRFVTGGRKKEHDPFSDLNGGRPLVELLMCETLYKPKLLIASSAKQLFFMHFFIESLSFHAFQNVQV